MMNLKSFNSTKPDPRSSHYIINSTCIYYVRIMIDSNYYETFDTYQIKSSVFEVHYFFTLCKCLFYLF